MGKKRLLVLLAAGLASVVVVALVIVSVVYQRPAGDVPPVPEGKFLHGATVRLLIVGDPFSNALQKAARELGARAGGTITIEVVGYDDVRRLTLLNSRDVESAFDIVSFDSVWTGEFGAKNVLYPLDDLIAAARAFVQPDDFIAIAYRQAQYQGRQIGLPIQPHPELFWYRKDLFEAAGVAPPVTIEDVLAAAKRFTRPARNQYGICWNGQRGQALGQQMAHFYAAFGQQLLDEAGRPWLNTSRAIGAARYALALLPYSPPDVLNMAWDQRTSRFSQRGCAMTYEWAARTYLVEQEPTSQVAGKVGYTAAPHAPGVEPVTSIGTWSLGIPANIGERRNLAWQFLAWVTSSEIERYLAQQGNGGTPRYSVLRDPSLIKRYPAFATVERLSIERRLADWMRPAVPQWSELANILGTVYHDMLRGELTPEQAAARAQEQAMVLFKPAE